MVIKMNFIMAFLAIVGIGVNFSGMIFVALEIANSITKNKEVESKTIMMFSFLTSSFVFCIIVLLKNI